MNFISPSGFLYKDFIKYILPTAIAATLFVPFFIPHGTTISFDILVFLVVLFGYIIYSPIASLADIVQTKLPLSNLRLDDTKKDNEWLRGIWDYDALWSMLEKDDREYLYLTFSYVEFYQTVGFYFLVYTIINITWFIWKLIENWPKTTINFNIIFSQIVSITTPTIVNINFPSLLFILIGLLLTYFLFGDAQIEYHNLFSIKGQFDLYAENYQKKKGGIASGISGKIVYLEGKDEKLIEEPLKINLRQGKKLVVTPIFSDDKGNFQILNAFKMCVGVPCKIEVENIKWEGSKGFIFKEDTLPYIKLIVSRKKVKTGN